MKNPLTDTSMQAQQLQMRLWQAASPAKKAALLCQLHAATQNLAMVGLAQRFPQASAMELRRLLAAERYGEHLATQAFGPVRHAA